MQKLYTGVQLAPTTGLKSLFTDMAPDLKLVLGFAIAALAISYTPYINNTVVAYVFSLAMITFMPGYSFMLAIFPGKTEIDLIGRVLLSFALSIMVAFLSALVLYLASGAISPGLLMVILTLPTVIFTLIANKERHNIPPGVRFSIDVGKAYKTSIGQFFPSNEKGLSRDITAILMIALVLSISIAAYIVIVPAQGDKYTEFYILGPDGIADHYPIKYNFSDTKPIIVGVINNEGRDMGYSLVVSLNDSGAKTTIYSERITVANSKTWEKTIDLMPDHASDRMDMEFLLYTNDNPIAPYRSLHLWVSVASPEAAEA